MRRRVWVGLQFNGRNLDIFLLAVTFSPAMLSFAGQLWIRIEAILRVFPFRTTRVAFVFD